MRSASKGHYFPLSNPLGGVTFLLALTRQNQVNQRLDNRRHRYVLTLFIAVFALSCISPPYPKYFVLQHIPTVLALVTLVVVHRWLHISFTSYCLLLAFLGLHLLGARYLYTFVPYDTWAETLFGTNITIHFEFTRNHYDRLVHFFYGLLISVPAYRFHRRFFSMSPLWASLMALEFIIATSAFYELMEWLAAILFAPDWAESYNGQQGDMWDAQKDILLV